MNCDELVDVIDSFESDQDSIRTRMASRRNPKSVRELIEQQLASIEFTMPELYTYVQILKAVPL